ncbi:MAG TPA: YihY/virulence factor BrkB family protein [Chryseolinea sp.]|nr:YihY/virulence factor BrkB family protein [Chryseolinea sp.]HPM31014.1 YihY/virulence factor BrkB family protein [Chryseolinea sp.]
MQKFLSISWSITKKTVLNFFNGDSFSHASSIAFSTIFSLPAILIIAISIGATFYERDTVKTELLNQVGALIGKESTIQIEKIIQNATFDMNSFLARVIGIGTLLFSATTVFMALQSSLNSMWGIKSKPQKSWLKFIFNRLLSFAMVISLGFVLLVSLLIDTLLVIFQNIVARFFDGITTYILSGVNFIVSLLIIIAIFGLMFKVLPDAKIRWRDVWVGATITTILFTLGKYLIGFYIGNSPINSAYGAAGSLVVILIWVYYSTVIFLLGAEVTSVYATESGRPIEPYAHAVRFKVVEIPNEKSLLK